MNRILMITVVMAIATGFAFAEDAKVNPELEKLVAQLKSEIEKVQPKFPDGATDDQKKSITETYAKVRKFAIDSLLPLCTNPIFVKEVTAQNNKKTTLDEIKRIDIEWQKAEDEIPIIKEKLNNTCAQEIKRLIKEVKELKVVGETFVMDNLGANVGQNELTSDYWQGDEAKWKNSYKDGKGGVDFSEPKLDKSTNVVDQKVSLPVIDEKGKVIGAVCFGVRSNEL